MNARVAGCGLALAFICGCALPPLPSGEITCDLSDTSARCPDGYGCLNIHKDDRSVCVKLGCGDGNVDLGAARPEECDDANENALDLCSAECKAAHFDVDQGAIVGFGPNGTDPKDTSLDQPVAVTVDRDGNFYIAAVGSNVVYRVDKAATKVTTFAGSGSIVDVGGGQNRPPNEVAIPTVGGLAVDGQGNLYITDLFAAVIRRVDAITGTVDTVVAARPRTETGGPQDLAVATTAFPRAVAVDGDGVVYYVDIDDVASGENGVRVGRIRRVDPVTGAAKTMNTGVDARGTPQGYESVSFDDLGRFYALGDSRLLMRGDEHSPGIALNLDVTGPQPTCPAVQPTQKKIAVAPDGSSVFYASNNLVVRVEVPGTLTPDAVVACALVGTLPLAQNVDISLTGSVFSNPGAIDLVFDRTTKKIALADPTNGVVWTLDAAGADVNRTDHDSVLGTPAGDSPTAFTSTAITELAEQTDGRISISETRNCRFALPPNPARLDRKNLELFLAFPGQNRVTSVGCDDTVAFLAGNGTAGADDGGGDPLRAQLNNPVAAVRARDDNIYIADRDNDAIRMINPTAAPGGVISTVLGHGVGPALAGSRLQLPSGLAVDDSGRLLIADGGNGRIVRVDPATFETEVLVDNLDEPSALVFVPYAFSPNLLSLATACDVPLDTVTQDPCGMLIFAERTGHRVRAIALQPLLNLPFDLAGGPSGAPPAPGDRDSVDVGGVVHSELRFPRGLMVDPLDLLSSSSSSAGGPPAATLSLVKLFIVDGVHRMRTLGVDNFTLLPPAIQTSVHTVTAVDAQGVGLPSSDDAVDHSGSLRGPVGIAAIDDDHAIIVESVTGRLRLWTVSTGALSSVAGLPSGTHLDPSGVVPASEAVPLEGAAAVAYDVAAGVLYASESKLHQVRRFQLVDPGDPSTWTTDVLPQDSDAIVEPTGLAVDPSSSDLFIADRATHVVVRVAPDGKSTVVAGQANQRGFGGDSKPGDKKDKNTATGALLDAPEGLLFAAREGKRLLYIADAGNERVRRVDLAANRITTVLGDGSSANGGEGAPARSFPVFSPRGLGIDAAGNLFVTAGNAIRIVQADTFFDATSEAGVADGADAVATIFGAPPRDKFPEPVTRCLQAVEVAPHTKGTATKVLAVDSCLGVALTLERSEK